MPILIGMHRQDISPGPGEVRFASPLLLKDKKLAGDGSVALTLLVAVRPLRRLH